MKQFTAVPKIYTIDICIRVAEGLADISAATAQERADYDNFIINVASTLDYFGFEFEFYQSDKSETSWYFDAVLPGKDTASPCRCVIYLRVSDHKLPIHSDGPDATERTRRKYYEHKAKQYAKSIGKDRIRWHLLEVLVDSKRCEDYLDAIFALEDRLKKIVKRHKEATKVEGED